MLTELRVLRAMDLREELLSAGELDRQSESGGDWTGEASEADSEAEPEMDPPVSPASPSAPSPRHALSLSTAQQSGSMSILPIHWASTSSPPPTPTTARFGFGSMTPIYATHSRSQSDSTALPEQRSRSSDGWRGSETSHGSQELEATKSGVPRTMRCLQLDLRGLDGSDDAHLGKSCAEVLGESPREGETPDVQISLVS